MYVVENESRYSTMVSEGKNKVKIIRVTPIKKLWVQFRALGAVGLSGSAGVKAVRAAPLVCTTLLSTRNARIT